jgi:polygalacturonase
MKAKYFLLSVMVLCLAFHLSASFYNVKDFGAKGDGKTVDSPAINKAIEKAASNGGGTVYFPSGTYLSYSIHLKNNITLFLDNGSILLAAYPKKDSGYDIAEPNDFSAYQDFGHSHWENSLIWGIGLDNIVITGFGLINGEGLTREESHIPGVGNKTISLKLCKNVTISNISMLQCGHFALLATGVDNITIHNVKVDTNRDGFDIDCCRNVRISDCTVNSPWDDAIVLKSSYALGFFRDTEKVTIANCFVSGYDRGTMLNATFQKNEPQAPDHDFATGRIKLGTESSGGFKNIAITNCVFENCRGIALETVDGGSLEDVSISNITMRDIVNAPIFLRLGARQRSPQGTPIGKMSRITISDLTVYNADSRFSSIISGIPGNFIEEVTLNNIRIIYRGKGTKEDANLIPPENEERYPEPSMFGTIPASGFFIRHARQVKLNNVFIGFLSPDYRPLIWASDVDGLKIHDLEAKQETGVKAFELHDVTHFETQHCEALMKN